MSSRRCNRIHESEPARIPASRDSAIVTPNHTFMCCLCLFVSFPHVFCCNSSGSRTTGAVPQECDAHFIFLPTQDNPRVQMTGRTAVHGRRFQTNGNS